MNIFHMTFGTMINVKHIGVLLARLRVYAALFLNIATVTVKKENCLFMYRKHNLIILIAMARLHSLDFFNEISLLGFCGFL